jgi:NTE family protein
VKRQVSAQGGGRRGDMPSPAPGVARRRAGGGTPRRGLVLGAGGVLGFAWAVGALKALEEAGGFDCREVEMLVGTSAGSITAALLANGVSVDSMVRHQQGIPAPGDPAVDYDHDGGGPLPPIPTPSMGSPSLLARTARHPMTVTPFAALSSVLPLGRATLGPVHRLVDRQLPEGESWAPHRSLWVVAMDYDSGRRVVFGRSGSPPARLPDAVCASCAIPGWFAPIEIAGRRYVDGGTCSSTSLDLLADQGLDEVYVVAPMTSFAMDEPNGVAARLERGVRRAITRRMMREAQKVQASGARVTMLGPGPDDLAAIGANLMDPTRRLAVLETSLRTSAAALSRDVDPYGTRHADGSDEPDPTDGIAS